MWQNIPLTIFKGEQPVSTYYVSPVNIYGLGVHDASNNIFSVYTWDEFEVNKGMSKISSCLLFWINAKE